MQSEFLTCHNFLNSKSVIKAKMVRCMTAFSSSFEQKKSVTKVSLIHKTTKKVLWHKNAFISNKQKEMNLEC